MKHIIIIGFLFFLYQANFAQRNSDIGLIIGGSSYVGDLNPGRQFYKPRLSAGGLARFNLNKRFAVRLSGTYISIAANEADFDNLNLPYPHQSSFAAKLLEISSQLEFNFLPYITGDSKWLSSTYVAGGIGYTFNLTTPTNFLIIPFGIGMKLNVTDRLSAGLEWRYRKTFNDKIDRVTSPLGKSVLHNNDWYSTYGLFITYKFVKFAADCPTYK